MTNSKVQNYNKGKGGEQIAKELLIKKGFNLIESNYSTQHFKVKDVETGFEALEIANEIYESGKIHYSHPNFITYRTLH